ncbi:MAG: stage V sporulation protein AE [Eubacteriales bacterium]
MDYIWVFVTGGIICVIAQVIMDKTKLLPAHVLVLFVTSGVILTAVGIYPKIVEFGKAGATVPLIGFGYSLAKGVIEAVDAQGLMGAFSGGVTSTATGISAAVFFGYIASVFSHSKSKK